MQIDSRNDIAEALKTAVLSTQHASDQQQLHAQEVASLSEALTDTTSLDQQQVSSVLRNIEEEKSAPTRASTIFSNFPALDAQTIRICVFLACGVLAYSGFRSAEITELESEALYDQSARESKIDFRMDTILFSSLLHYTYLTFHKNHNRYPNTLLELNKYEKRLSDSLQSYKMLDSYDLRKDGSVIINLTESYGYHRWIQLTPRIKKGPLSDGLDFDCASNAESALLEFDNYSWCDHQVEITSLNSEN